MRKILIFTVVTFFITPKSNGQHYPFGKYRVPFCDTLNSEVFQWNSDTVLYKRRIINVDRKICNEIILSTYRTPYFLRKLKSSILKNSVFDKEENETRLYFTNKQSSELCEVTGNDDFKRDYIDNAFQPRKIRVFKKGKLRAAPIPTFFKSFTTENNIRLGLSITEFFKIKDSIVFKKDTNSLKNTVTYYYSVQIFCKKEADWLFGKSNYGAGYPAYSCYYIFDLRTRKLIEYGIGM